jgi:diguanylate cyclase (GGDEF)-like protein
MGDPSLVIQTEQTAADAEQTASDRDQTASDADQASSAADQASADNDQRVADRDQATADREHARRHVTPDAERAYQAARDDRDADTFDRRSERLRRTEAARAREATARQRDRDAKARDDVGRLRDAQVIDRIPVAADPEMTLTMQLEALIAQATADRERAAADRVRAANDRAKAARQRARLEAELEQAHLDELTGAYRRGMGRMALAHETERARRSGGPFVLAFVDVDRLKEVNDHQGHAAGDQILQTVVRVIRDNLRSFDPVVRYGGDEFICGLSGASLSEARHRLGAIAAEISKQTGVGISVGLAALKPADTVERLMRRADAAMLRVKARHHARDPVRVMSQPTLQHRA